MKSRELQSKLLVLESLLNDFSYEELNTSEATDLKLSFNAFKVKLQDVIFRPALKDTSAVSLEFNGTERVSLCNTASYNLDSPTIENSLQDCINKSSESQQSSIEDEIDMNLLQNMQVLVFEDNFLNQKLVEQRLKKMGCIAHITENIQYGLKLLNNNEIDIVLMDLQMPEMNGFDVSDLIRKNKNEQIRTIPIIAYSAHFTSRDIERFKTLKINDYIVKSHSPEELRNKLIQHKKQMKNNMTMNNNSTTREALDLSELFEECGNEIEVLEELVLLYKQNAWEFIGAAKIHINNEDFEQLRFSTHKIINGLAMLKTYSLYDLAKQMNNICKTTKNIDQLSKLNERFIEEYPIVEMQIDEILSKLKNS